MLGGYRYINRQVTRLTGSFNYFDFIWFGLYRQTLSFIQDGIKGKAPSLHMYISCLNIHLQTRRSTSPEKESTMEGKKGHNIDNYYERGKRGQEGVDQLNPLIDEEDFN